MENLLTLQDYSTKYKVSISTLRRRIKCHELNYIFKAGRYFIKEPKAFNQSTDALKDQEEFYKELLEEKDLKIKKLKEEREDLIHLVAFLEEEKTHLESLIFNQHQSKSFFS